MSAEGERTLFDHADERSLRVPTSCRRSGRCRECVVEVGAGAEHLCPPTEAERFLRPPFRLACQAVVADAEAEVDFTIVRRRLRIVVPDPERRIEPIDPKVTVRAGDVCWGPDPIEPQHGGVYGLAIDVGTTTVAFELVDLLAGEVVEVVALENPQRFGGSDVMNRISYDGGQPGELRQALRRAINGELRELYARTGISRREVYEVVVVGNSTMRDIFFDLEVTSIGERPYKSSVELELLDGRRDSSELLKLGWELGLRSTRGRGSGVRRSWRATSGPTSPPIWSPPGSARETVSRCWSTSGPTPRSSSRRTDAFWPRAARPGLPSRGGR